MTKIFTGLTFTGTFYETVTEENIREMIKDVDDIEDEDEVHDWLLDNIFCEITYYASGSDSEFEVEQEDLEKIMEKAREIKEEMEEEDE